LCQTFFLGGGGENKKKRIKEASKRKYALRVAVVQCENDEGKERIRRGR
jgi:hypothetical protein